MTTTAPPAAPPTTRRRRRVGPRQWAADLALGIRLSIGGGASGWTRLALISTGIGIGVTMLLVATTIPAVMGARSDRIADRPADGIWAASDEAPPPTEQSILVDHVRSDFRDRAIDGLVIQAEGSDPVRPPGVSQALAPGDLVVSPALARLMESDEGAPLRGRWSDRVTGEIGPTGLAGPEELVYYLGVEQVSNDFAMRVTAFGESGTGSSHADPTGQLLGAVGLALLLAPVAIFVSTAVRFGGEARDRRLAALRLVGADTSMSRRIAAGETLAGAVLGLGLGGLLFVGLGQIAHRLVPADLSFYPADFQPAPVLAALVVVLVPLAAVLVTISAMQRVGVEPLGVVRRAAIRRRRLWGRLVLLIGGVALLSPLRSGGDAVSANAPAIVAGVVILLVGMAVLLPWLVEAVVRRMGAGPVAWQLAVRRLQLDSGTAVRSVSGVAVAVTGLIAMHGMTAAWTAAIGDDSGADTAQVYYASTDERWITRLEQTPGVNQVGTLTSVTVESTQGGSQPVSMQVGDCATLLIGREIDACTDGDVFVAAEQGIPVPEAGSVYLLGDARDGEQQEWTMPASTHRFPGGEFGYIEMLVTPGALAGIDLDRGTTPADLRVALDASTPDAVDHLRTAVSRLDPSAHVTSGDELMTRAAETVRQLLLVATGALLVIIGASMLVNIVEQLRERRQLLAVLLAFGTRRRTLSWSILWQIAIPMVLGLVLAVATGTALAAILQTAAGAPVQFDWLGIGATTGTAALVALLTTAASLPLLWRLTRAGGLRSE
ncbi:FtsX-like permease family protein [Cellulomonas timonensis]|uniref:FtsX-like permease family protein n=1 Tax=Cellulomonas timonensis TaxID=1689271 RepID=UPI0008311C50|nr:ABC transporter permease [Cellulomonas timonensis]